MEDYNWMVWVIDARLVEYKEYVQTVLSKEQYEELKVGVEKLTDMLSVQLKEAYTTLGKALPQEVDRLKEKHDVFYNQKLPELNELRRSFNLEPAYESGNAVLSPHPETEAEGMKFSEEDHKKCTTDNVEQGRDVFIEAEVAYHLPDKENRSEKITSE